MVGCYLNSSALPFLDHSMRTTELGSTGISCSVLGFGCCPPFWVARASGNRCVRWPLHGTRE